jgi:hypothetical protein
MRKDIGIRVLDEHEVKEAIGGIDRLHYEGDNPVMKDMVGLCNDVIDGINEFFGIS